MAATKAESNDTPFFGAELDGASSGPSSGDQSSIDESKNKVKAEDSKPPATHDQKPATTSSATTGNTASAASSAPASSATSTPATTSAATAPASTNASSARPHIDGSAAAPGSRPMVPQQQQRYPGAPNQMMQPGQPAQPGQPGAFPGQPGYPMNPQGMGMVPPGQPGMPANAQYMPQQFRPATSTYDEEMMRVKSMMMQHPDLIPPPMEVLRISMAQATVSQNMMAGNPNYMQRVGPQGQVMNRIGANQPGHPPYGAPNPNMMMPGQGTPSGMMDPRMRPMPQMNPQRQVPAARTPNGSSGATPESQTAWQSENDLPLRRKMIGRIVSLLQQRKPDAPAEWIRRLPDMARRLEDSLYRTAKNRDEYGDFSSLKTRLQHLAVTMGARAQHKAGGATRPPGVSPATGVMNPAVPSAMGMNPAVPVGMPAQGHVAGNMPYANMAGRMTQQQLLQQQQLQMQMQNPQMRQQFTPQQLQQFQAAQMQRRQFQMQQAQLQRQNSQQTPGQQAQQFQANQAAVQQRQNAMRQQSGQPNQQQMQQQMNQRAQQNPNFMQQGQNPAQSQQQQAQGSAQGQSQNPQLQRRGSMNNVNTSAGRQSADMSSLGQGLGSDTDFLNLDLSQSFMNEDLSVDGGFGTDSMKTNDQSMSGAKRTLSQTQQAMAAAANAAAFKRSKVANGTTPQGSNPHSPRSSQNSMQKPASGSSKTPPMSTVNAK
ncbi:hypothetical protein Poli38472_004119 [Pythium oligandrum]|uniref:Mediator complex subunit 15 KIX domain-containing protein n=1 Tax=Pythium oligandrum TaxID=41045 RepID=A0A8K1CMR5_PYTOL|nr:hypothetical protein Poli38472_004119 [Pythium oligandrum]|eukprot:TMW66354.1 hypothetical protein Poli38472_004119 [Pythium oligandrum]